MRLNHAKRVGRILSRFFVIGLLVCFFLQYRERIRMREENQSLRRQIVESAAERELNAPAIQASNASHQMPEAEFRELLRLRGEVANLRRQQEAAAKDRAATKATPVPAQNQGI